MINYFRKFFRATNEKYKKTSEKQKRILKNSEKTKFSNKNFAKFSSKIGFMQSSQKENVAIIGMGYVGFPLTCAIAKSGKYNVYGLDINEERINKIKNKISPIEDYQACKDIKKVKINATMDFSILQYMDYILICVPTPVTNRKDPDLTPIKKVVFEISKNLRPEQIIILESTVNPGVCEEVVLPLLEKTGLKGGIDFELVHCPERINPGDSHWNVYNIPRNIGGLTKEGTKKAADFYRSFINAEINEMSSLKVVESTKIVENTFRDINIAYVNELAKSFDKLGIDVLEVIKGASNKPFAFMPHYPGCGIGGHCIPVDPYYLIDYAKKNGFNHRLLKTARKINNSMPAYTLELLFLHLRKINIPIENAKIGVLGISYKANVGDTRESPALELISKLKKLKADVFSYDPYCLEESNSELKEILDECDAVIIATAHKEFIKIKKWGNIKIIVDGRNCLDKTAIEKSGIVYVGIGRGVDKKATEKSIVNENRIDNYLKTRMVISQRPAILLNKIERV